MILRDDYEKPAALAALLRLANLRDPQGGGGGGRMKGKNVACTEGVEGRQQDSTWTPDPQGRRFVCVCRPR